MKTIFGSTRYVCFYLDGVIFWYKKNPVDDARSLHSQIWRKRNGLDPGCVAKGSHKGSGGRTVNMIVAISYMKGVIFCEYQKLVIRNYIKYET